MNRCVLGKWGERMAGAKTNKLVSELLGVVGTADGGQMTPALDQG